MGCVLNYKGQEFKNKSELAKFILAEQKNESVEKAAKMTPEEALETHLTNSRAEYEERFQKWYEENELHLDDEVTDALTNAAVKSNEIISRNTLLESIKKMNEVFDAVVIIDDSIDTLGELLPSDHALSIQYKKPVILINSKLAKQDTVFHEFAHLYIDLLGGSADANVSEAFRQLTDTALFLETKDKYPELSEEMLNREVLAQAMGLEASDIFGKELSEISAFQRVINKIFNALSNLLGIRTNAVRQLARELVENKVRESDISRYNTLISQKQKVQIDGSNRAEVIQLVEKHFLKNKVIETETERYYEIVDGSTSKKVSGSVTDVLEKKKGLKSIRKVDVKGDIMMKFDSDQYTLDNIMFYLGHSRIPKALDEALNDLFTAQNKLNDINKTWDAYQMSESLKKLTQSQTLDDPDDPLNNLVNAFDKTTEEIIKDSFDVLMEKATQNQLRYEMPLFAGNMVHKSVEDFIKTGVFSGNIKKDDDLFFNYISKLITDGRANGSTFYSEVSIYSPLNNLPGTIDLLEIKSDGTFVIHDYKTTKSFFTKEKTRELTDEELFLNKGYVAQLMIYGKILEEYGMKPANNQFNLIATQVKYKNLTGAVTDEITVNGLKTFSFSKGSNFGAKINSKVMKMYNNVSKAIRTIQVELIEGKKETSDYGQIVIKIKQDIETYKRLADKFSSATGSKNMKELETLYNSIEADKAKVDDIKLKLGIESFISGMAAQMAVLESDFHADSSIDQEYLQSYKYVIQMMDNMFEIQALLDEDSENRLGFNDINVTKQQVNAIIANIARSKQFYKDQVVVHAAYNLSKSSNLMYGVYKEKFSIKLRKDGLTNKHDRDQAVDKLLLEHRSEIFAKEVSYWESQYRNGFIDLRSWEYLFADPGMSRSQFVQVTKRLIDQANIGTRGEVDSLMPALVSWEKGLTYNSGDPKDMWKDILEKRTVVDSDGNKITDLNGSVIAQYTSDYRELYFKYITQREQYLDEKKALKSKEKHSPADLLKIDALDKLLDDLNKEFAKDKTAIFKKPGSRTLRETDAFKALSEEKKKDLIFIHKNLRQADARLDTNTQMKLTKFLYNKEIKDFVDGEGEYVYNLPRQRMSSYEAGSSLSKTAGRFISGLKEFGRPPADIDEATYIDNSENDRVNGSLSDIKDGEFFSIPVYHRASLGAERDLQSYDIPTLLAMNHETTARYSHNKTIEADLFVISESLRLSESVQKTDNLLNETVEGAFKRARKSDMNLVYKAVTNQINNRIYARHYSGVYSKTNYKVMKIASSVKSLTSVTTLAGNFMSALNTTGTGSIYKFIEGVAGEYYDLESWRKGYSKTYGDMSNMLSDTQKFFPESKTNLLIRLLGLDNQYKALTNQFIQKNLITKNLDSSAVFALTSIAETVVTSNLMYSLTSQIKMLNANGDYINKEGRVVAKEEAMSFDEAYEVIDGVLVLNKHAAYSTRDFANKLVDGDGLNLVALSDISGYTKSVYADLFGQYDSELKSVVETTMIGSMALSMKKWLPRGMHKRFRGFGTQLKWNSDMLDFDQSKEEGNMLNRFYSQDQQTFQEGYYVTGIKFARVLYKELKKGESLLGAYAKIKDTMSDHEVANLTRTISDLVQMAGMFMAMIALRSLANGMGDDPRDKVAKERAYFGAYLALRVFNDSYSFLNMTKIITTASDPMVPIGTLMKFTDVFMQAVGFHIDDEDGFAWNASEEYDSGKKKGEKKIFSKALSSTPGAKNAIMLSTLFGINDDPYYSIEDTYKFYEKKQ